MELRHELEAQRNDGRIAGRGAGRLSMPDDFPNRDPRLRRRGRLHALGAAVDRKAVKQSRGGERA